MIDDAILGSVAIVTTATSIRTEQQTIRVHLPVLPVLYPQKQLLLEYGSRHNYDESISKFKNSRNKTRVQG